MALQPKQRLGPYEILSAIGAGGMGEVYEAKGVKLHRRVALKFLPEELKDDPAALERFQRKAFSALASEHANIRGGVWIHPRRFLALS